jgi:hypothetical protein
VPAPAAPVPQAVAPAAAPGAPLLPPPVVAVATAVEGMARPGKAAAPTPAVTPAPTPTPANDPSPEAEKEKKKKKDDCPPQSVKINWPPPVWSSAGRKDSGAVNGAYNRPPRLLTRRTPPARNRTIIGEYVGENWAALSSFYPKSGTLGAIHHKWPLYLGGPDSKDNLVFLTFAEHTAWHSMLTSQTLGPVGTVYCIVTYL